MLEAVSVGAVVSAIVLKPISQLILKALILLEPTQ